MDSAAVESLPQLQEPRVRVSDPEIVGVMIQIYCGFSDKQQTETDWSIKCVSGQQIP